MTTIYKQKNITEKQYQLIEGYLMETYGCGATGAFYMIEEASKPKIKQYLLEAEKHNLETSICQRVLKENNGIDFHDMRRLVNIELAKIYENTKEKFTLMYTEKRKHGNHEVEFYTYQNNKGELYQFGCHPTKEFSFLIEKSGDKKKTRLLLDAFVTSGLEQYSYKGGFNEAVKTLFI